MKQHPLSAVFPSLPEQEMNALTADIKANGIRQPIITYEGMVLDGWHRYQISQKLKVPVVQMPYRGTDPVAFVRSLNYHRRHLTKSQLAMVEVGLSEWLPNGRRPTTSAPGTSAPGAEVAPKTTGQMAAAAGVGARTIEQAKTVAAKGSKELQEQVTEGKVSLKEAERIVKGKPEKAVKPAKPAPKPAPKSTAVPVEKYQKLADKYKDAQESLRDLADELQSVEAIRTGETAKEMKILRESLKAANRARDDAMNTAAELRKQCEYYKRELKKLGWAPAK